MKYKYVVYLSSFPYYRVAYGDLREMERVTCVEDIRPVRGGWIFRFMWRIWCRLRLNTRIGLPFKLLLGWFFVPKGLNPDPDLCFIFMSTYCLPILPYLKKKYNKAKYVLYYHDILSKSNLNDIPSFLNQFDLTILYDREEAEFYKVKYHPTPFSLYSLPADEKYKSDVFFLGGAKDRLHTILKAYEDLCSLGLKCRFFIHGLVPKEVKDKYPDIVFFRRGVSYMENLNYVRNSSCVLEVMQKGAIGYTPRVWEAIAYDKLLITNNESLRNSPFYHPDYMHIGLEDIRQTLPGFMRTVPAYSKEVKESMSPKHVLAYIDSLL